MPGDLERPFGDGKAIDRHLLDPVLRRDFGHVSGHSGGDGFPAEPVTQQAGDQDRGHQLIIVSGRISEICGKATRMMSVMNMASQNGATPRNIRPSDTFGATLSR